MLNIAKEMNLSETAFLLEPSYKNAHFKVRYFTRGGEIDFCGHATVALSWVLGDIYQYVKKTQQLILETNIGIIPVDFSCREEKLQQVLMQQVKPQVKDFNDTKSIFEILGISQNDYDENYEIKLAYTGNWHL